MGRGRRFTLPLYPLIVIKQDYLANLDDQTVQLQLTSGSIRIRVKRMDEE